MEKIIEEYYSYLRGEKKASQNTFDSYRRDINRFMEYVKSKGIIDITKVLNTTILDYELTMQQSGKSASTISRTLSAIKSLFGFLQNNKYITENPTKDLHNFKFNKKPPHILSDMQIDVLLDMPILKNAKGYRDKAILELLYATGLRVSDLLLLKTSDVNLSVGYVYTRKNGKERIIPIYSIARESVRDYIEKRKGIPNSDKTDILFLNLNGTPISRQGIWKMVKYYQKKSGMNVDITPHSIRHSFALHLLENGADLKSVSNFLGHNDISSTQIYEEILKNKMSDVYKNAHPRAKKMKTINNKSNK